METIIENRFVYTENSKNLGKFYFGGGKKTNKKSILRPVFLIQNIPNTINDRHYIPGYLDVEKDFYKCPVEIFYTEIDNITTREEKDGFRTYSHLELDIKVFNKDFSEYRQFNFKYVKEDFSSFITGKVDLIVNIINEYIDSGRELSILNLNRISKDNLSNKNKLQLIEIIENLKIEFYEDSRSIVGKDNYFWVDAEIQNFTDDIYLNNLIYESLKKQYKNIEKTDFGLVVQIEYSTAYSPSYGRRKIENYKREEDFLKKNLMLDFVFAYSEKEHIFDQMTDYVIFNIWS